MFGIRTGRAFDGERVVPSWALTLIDVCRIAGWSSRTSRLCRMAARC